MTELFHTDLDDAALYKARLANVERDRLLHEIARLRARTERDRDTWQRELAIELEQSQALGDALVAAVEALLDPLKQSVVGTLSVTTHGVESDAVVRVRAAARAWRKARG